jgi:hypothetical protein
LTVGMMIALARNHCPHWPGIRNDCRAGTTRVADRAEQVDRVMAIVAHHRRTRAEGRPNILQ